MSALGEHAGIARASHARLVAALSALRLGVSALTLALGFRAVSDDDFARVVIAQDFAHSPKLDPSGTSWLPLPFWIDGGVMIAFGRSLAVAVAVALASGIVSTALTYVAGLWLTRDRASAFVGAAIATVMPWSARLGVSTVPELWTASLTLLGAAAVSTATTDPRRTRRMVLGALALFAATLSRYEPWFVALGFAGLTLVDAARSRERAATKRLGELACAGAALAGAALWVGWNEIAHGSPLHFLDRVSAYRDAIDHGALSSRVGGYLFALARAEPELLAIAAATLGSLFTDRPYARAILAPFARPALLSALLLATLTASSIRGGAPTHHPERALFVLFLLLALALGHAIVALARSPERAPSRRTVAIVVIAVAGLSFPVRRWVLQGESFARRDAEVDIGRVFARSVPPGSRALLGVSDYGFFAIQAASGRPEDLVPDHKIDPARPTDPFDAAALVDLARREGYALALARRPAQLPRGARTIAQNDAFMILDVEPTR